MLKSSLRFHSGGPLVRHAQKSIRLGYHDGWKSCQVFSVRRSGRERVGPNGPLHCDMVVINEIVRFAPACLYYLTLPFSPYGQDFRELRIFINPGLPDARQSWNPLKEATWNGFLFNFHIFFLGTIFTNVDSNNNNLDKVQFCIRRSTRQLEVNIPVNFHGSEFWNVL